MTAIYYQDAAIVYLKFVNSIYNPLFHPLKHAQNMKEQELIEQELIAIDAMVYVNIYN